MQLMLHIKGIFQSISNKRPPADAAVKNLHRENNDWSNNNTYNYFTNFKLARSILLLIITRRTNDVKAVQVSVLIQDIE